MCTIILWMNTKLKINILASVQEKKKKGGKIDTACKAEPTKRAVMESHPTPSTVFLWLKNNLMLFGVMKNFGNRQWWWLDTT